MFSFLSIDSKIDPQLSLTPVPMDLISSSELQGHYTCRQSTHEHKMSRVFLNTNSFCENSK